MLTFRFTGVDGTMVAEETLTSGSVGKNVKLEFSKDWDNMTKTAVFMAGSVTRNVVNVSDVVTIPAEVLSVPLEKLYVGVYGTSGDGRVIPTIRAEGPRIEPGVDPSGDGGTDPGLPMWAQLQQEIDEVRRECEENSVKTPSEVVLYTAQELPPEQQAQARANIGAANRTGMDTFRQNCSIAHCHDANTGTNYTAIRVFKNKIDGTEQRPFVYVPNGQEKPTFSALEIAERDNWLLTINAGIGGTVGAPHGTLIQDGKVVVQGPTAHHPTNMPLTINSSGDLWYAACDADAAALAQGGIVSAVCGFMPIVKEYTAVPAQEWNECDHYTARAQRQIIGQYGNGDYAIITCEGRSHDNSPGWTIQEAQAVCVGMGLKFAYNLDGGNSTGTVVGVKQLNTIYELEKGRRVPAFIVFDGGTEPPAYTGAVENDDLPDVTLPDGYTLLPYIEVNGKQYVNTMIPETEQCAIEYAFAPNAGNGTDSAGHILSSKNVYYPYLRYSGTNRQVMVQRMGTQRKIDFAFEDNTKYVVGAYSGGSDDIAINGTVVGSVAKGTATLDAAQMLYLFAYGGDLSATRFCASGKCYYVKIFSESGELLHDYVPCRNSSGTVGMYDTVASLYHASESGTGFIAPA